jgi:hypothetical protein
MNIKSVEPDFAWSITDDYMDAAVGLGQQFEQDMKELTTMYQIMLQHEKSGCVDPKCDQHIAGAKYALDKMRFEYALNGFAAIGMICGHGHMTEAWNQMLAEVRMNPVDASDVPSWAGGPTEAERAAQSLLGALDRTSTVITEGNSE